MLRSYEAIVAIAIVSTAFILLFKEYESYPQAEEAKLVKIFNSIKSLDANNELRGYVLENDSEIIEKKLSKLLPEFNLMVKICEDECEKPNLTQEFISVTYLIAGDVNNFNPKQMVIYAW